MAEWKYHDYRPEGFESWSAIWGSTTNERKRCELCVAKIGENRYTVWWYDRGFTDIKTHIDAADFEEAKKTAIVIVQNTLNSRAGFWRDMSDGFKKWSEGLDNEIL